MNRFEQKLADHQLTLRREALQVLQINIGRKCNQACRHCHVDAAPWRTEMIDEATAHRIGEWIQRFCPPIVDITGGAPELSDYFRYFVETARSAGSHVIDRNNLTIIEEPGFAWLPEFLAKHDLHVHVPAGAIPKDGPSAGVTMATAILSAARNTPVRQDVAMTGEITLSGLVLPVGGIREKVLAAKRAGIRTVILPAMNEADLTELPEEVRTAMRFVPAETLEQVVKVAFHNES